MKFIDTFNEDDKKKLTKKAKLIYSVLKKGTITRSDGVKFSYELGDNMVPSVVNGEIELFAFITKITERTYCPINEIAMSDLIIKKFEQFDIKVDLQIPKSIEIVKYQGKKPWEESLNEEIDIDKERNRVKTVHKALRKGVVSVSGVRFRYELPEEYTFHVVDEPHLQVTAIKFTFYNKDLTSDVGGGHGLPLKIWRIEDGKDVYLNKMLTGQDVGDITYNDEYNINTKTGVDYVNAKNKVRNRYRNFNINAIMTTPSDSINEEIDRTYLKKLKKKGEVVYKLYKKGKLVSDREDGEIHYTYELSDNKLINAYGDTISISPDNIKIKYHNELTNKFALLPITDSIKKRFHNHGITLNIPRWTEIYIDEWKEPINESEDKYEELREKMIKKGKTVYKALRKGTIGGNDPDEPKFSYVLSDDFSINMNNLGILIFTDGIKIKELNRECNIVSTGYMQSKIRDRFEQFGIVLTSRHLTSDDIEPWERPTINEGRVGNIGMGITEKELKKVSMVYKALKKGFFKYDYVSIYGYELPDNYHAYRDYNEDRNEFGNVCIKMTGQNDQEPKFFSKLKFTNNEIVNPIKPEHEGLRDWVKDKVIEKFKQFDIKFIF
jgi:hypothetical protein